MPRISSSREVVVRIGAGWAGSYTMTRAFARALPGEPAVAIIADVMNRLDLLAAGELDLVWAFPMTRVRWAYQGHRPWPESPWRGEPLSNLRLVARFPRVDRELVAFAPWSPVQSLAEIVARRNVRIAMRTDELYEFEHAIFQQYGFTLADIVRGGGRYWHITPGAHELDRELAERSVDLVIGHASTSPIWRVVAEAGFRFAPLEERVVAALERVGFERHVLEPGALPWITEPMLTLDLSDQPLVARAEADAEVIYEITRSIDRNREAIHEAGREQVEGIDRHWEAAGVPLHPGAERYYREAGYIRS